MANTHSQQSPLVRYNADGTATADVLPESVVSAGSAGLALAQAPPPAAGRMPGTASDMLVLMNGGRAWRDKLANAELSVAIPSAGHVSSLPWKKALEHFALWHSAVNAAIKREEQEPRSLLETLDLEMLVPGWPIDRSRLAHLCELFFLAASHDDTGVFVWLVDEERRWCWPDAHQSVLSMIRRITQCSDDDLYSTPVALAAAVALDSRAVKCLRSLLVRYVHGTPSDENKDRISVAHIWPGSQAVLAVIQAEAARLADPDVLARIDEAVAANL